MNEDDIISRLTDILKELDEETNSTSSDMTWSPDFYIGLGHAADLIRTLLDEIRKG